MTFNLAIAIFALVAGSYGWVNTYFGCNGKFSGVMESWRGVDTYLQKVDTYLCSPQCECYINNYTGYTLDPAINATYSTWATTTVQNAGNVAFQNCSIPVQNTVYNEAANADAYFDPEKNFNQENFANYMANVENEFQCSGWCGVNYVNSLTNKPTTMHKYLFTDVNRGPPSKLGCLDSVILWLPPYLTAFGSVTMVLWAFQVI
jgi:hypothetical protein